MPAAGTKSFATLTERLYSRNIARRLWQQLCGISCAACFLLLCGRWLRGRLGVFYYLPAFHALR